MTATHTDGTPSSRYRDLADLVLLTTTQRIAARPLHEAIADGYQRLGLTPTALTLPSPAWTDRYPPIARKMPGLAHQSTYHDANTALDLVRQLLEPVVTSHRHNGTWDPDTQQWND